MMRKSWTFASGPVFLWKENPNAADVDNAAADPKNARREKELAMRNLSMNLRNPTTFLTFA
jgi:hypothetical protein